jgi:hypothetical protein
MPSKQASLPFLPLCQCPYRTGKRKEAGDRKGGGGGSTKHSSAGSDVVGGRGGGGEGVKGRGLSWLAMDQTAKAYSSFPVL